MSFAGLTFIQSDAMVDQNDPQEDWSRVRSPSRAARRRRHGHRQNIRIYYPPRKDCLRAGDKVFIHPVTYRELAKMLTEQRDAMVMKGLGLAGTPYEQWDTPYSRMGLSTP